jgi:hypothetical protein
MQAHGELRGASLWRLVVRDSSLKKQHSATFFGVHEEILKRPSALFHWEKKAHGVNRPTWINYSVDTLVFWAYGCCMSNASPTDHTPPNGTLTVSALRTMAAAARANATTLDERTVVERAEIAIDQYANSDRDYRSTASLVMPLEAITTKATEARPFVRDVTFVASESQPGVYWRVVGSSCTCPAGSHGRVCKHLRAASKGDGWRAAPVMTSESARDPFAKVQR